MTDEIDVAAPADEPRVSADRTGRSLTQQLAGKTDEIVWKAALVEIEDALVPAFIVEELDEGRYTVFVPSAPTPLAGAVYVLSRSRVHPIDVQLQAIRSISRWGAGSGELVAAIEKKKVADSNAA